MNVSCSISNSTTTDQKLTKLMSHVTSGIPANPRCNANEARDQSVLLIRWASFFILDWTRRVRVTRAEIDSTRQTCPLIGTSAALPGLNPTRSLGVRL